MKRMQTGKWTLLVAIVLSISTMGATANAVCVIDHNDDQKVDLTDLFVAGQSSGSYYADWSICYYTPHYADYYGIDCNEIDYNKDGVVNLLDLTGGGSWYQEYYIFTKTSENTYRSYYPDSTCLDMQVDVCPGKDPSIDADEDGIPDCIDGCVDLDADELCDRNDPCPGEDNRIDVDNDGLADCVDDCVDQDMDSVCDEEDECPGYSDQPDRNNDGIKDCLQVSPCNPNWDLDEDGVNDCADGCPLMYQKQAPGVCGCQDYDYDGDGDGVMDCNDICNQDPNKTDPGVCGCGVPDSSVDSDGDGIADCVDPCPFENPNDPDGDGLCGVAPVYCESEGDLDNDRICDDQDLCIGNDAFGDLDEDGWCEDIDDCIGDDLSGDGDGDGVCDDRDACSGQDNTGDWDLDGICNDLDEGCSNTDTDDFDGDGICNWDDPCFSSPRNDVDNDGTCFSNDPCHGDIVNDADRDGTCSYEDPCPYDAYNDEDKDGLCANIDMCLGDNSMGDIDSDGICEDLDVCYGIDLLGDADGDGNCDHATCRSDVPPFYDQTSSDIDWAAGGVCVETTGISGPPACPQSDFNHYREAMDWIMTNYPFAASVFDSQTGGGQTFAKIPYTLICSGFDNDTKLAPMFNDLNDCYYASSRCLFDCSQFIIDFDWGVNVNLLLSDYNQRAQEFGGECILDSLIGAPKGFHAQNLGGQLLWTVDATETCDFFGCRCDATLQVWSDPANPGWYDVESITNNSKFYMYQDVMCEDQRFNF